MTSTEAFGKAAQAVTGTVRADDPCEDEFVGGVQKDSTMTDREFEAWKIFIRDCEWIATILSVVADGAAATLHNLRKEVGRIDGGALDALERVVSSTEMAVDYLEAKAGASALEIGPPDGNSFGEWLRFLAQFNDETCEIETRFEVEYPDPVDDQSPQPDPAVMVGG